MRLEDLTPNATIRGLLPTGVATVVNVQWFGSEALELTYKDAAGHVATRHAAILSLRWLPSPDGGWIDVDKAIIHRKGFGERETHKRRSPARIPDRLMAHLRRWHRIDSAQGIVGVMAEAF